MGSAAARSVSGCVQAPIDVELELRDQVNGNLDVGERPENSSSDIGAFQFLH